MEKTNQSGWKLARACAEVSLKNYGTEKECEKDLNKKVKVLRTVAKALGLELWVDVVLVEKQR